jgi:ElaA protein
MHYKLVDFRLLTNEELYEILRLRSEVFVVEQSCIYQDMDGKDQKALHVIGSQDEAILSYARILLPTLDSENFSIGRVIVSSAQRGTGEGHRLMEFCLRVVSEQFTADSVHISAQSHLEKFYNYHGFKATGKQYLEDGIPHCEMILNFNPRP